MPTVALVTYRERPQLTAEDQLLCACLHTLGVKTEAVVWDAPGVAWERYQAVIVRSCWDYHFQPERFRRWLRRLAHLQAPLWNPAPILEWNMHKRYLHDLQAQGIAVPPTCWLARGDQATLPAILDNHGWQEAVVKPAISATAYQTWRTTPAQASQEEARFATLLQQADVLVQQFVAPVITQGEWSFVFFDRQYSHAVLKQAKAGDFRVQDDFGGTVAVRSPARTLIEQAQQVLDCVDGPLLFARVDGVELNGRFILMELELIEPYLFLDTDPQAVERFAQAIVAHLPSGGQEKREIA